MKKPSESPARMSVRHVVAALLLVAAAGSAGAAEPEPFNAARADHTAVAGPGPAAAARSVPAEALKAAVNRVNQAALQSGLASDSREIALLRLARDGLASPDVLNCCGLRTRVAKLDAELARVIARADRRPATLDSTGGAITNMPNRDELNALAREGQGLIRGEPAADNHWRDLGRRAARAEILTLALAHVADPIASAAGGSGSAIDAYPAALPLFTMRF